MQSNSELNRRVAERAGWRVEQVDYRHGDPLFGAVTGNTWILRAPNGSVWAADSQDEAWGRVQNYAGDLSAIMPLALKVADDLSGELTITPYRSVIEVCVSIPQPNDPTRYTMRHLYDAGGFDDLPRALCLLWLDYADMRSGEAACDERGAGE